MDADPPVPSYSLDPLIAMLVETREILPELFVRCRNNVTPLQRGEPASEISQDLWMEFVLM